MDPKRNKMWRFGLDLAGTGCGSVEGSRNRNTGTSESIKGEEYLDLLRCLQLVKEGSGPGSYT
jgi:hypothetical protein